MPLQENRSQSTAMVLDVVVLVMIITSGHLKCRSIATKTIFPKNRPMKMQSLSMLRPSFLRQNGMSMSSTNSGHPFRRHVRTSMSTESDRVAEDMSLNVSGRFSAVPY